MEYILRSLIWRTVEILKKAETIRAIRHPIPYIVKHLQDNRSYYFLWNYFSFNRWSVYITDDGQPLDALRKKVQIQQIISFVSIYYVKVFIVVFVHFYGSTNLLRLIFFKYFSYLKKNIFKATGYKKLLIVGLYKTKNVKTNESRFPSDIQQKQIYLDFKDSF